jgi:hypothetical protein
MARISEFTRSGHMSFPWRTLVFITIFGFTPCSILKVGTDSAPTLQYSAPISHPRATVFTPTPHCSVLEKSAQCIQAQGLVDIGDISGNMGLVSAGRINKDTPPLTTPSYTSKSSAMDTSSHIFEIVIHRATREALPPQGESLSCMTQGQSLFVCT